MYWNGPGSEIPIIKSYENSQSMEGQDEFVLNLLGEEESKFFVEIGSGHPKIGSNTWLLEKFFGWKGMAIDIDAEMVEQYRQIRSAECFLSDATTFNYRHYFDEHCFPKQIDYLQIDIDNQPKNANLMGLIALPLSMYRFSVLTIEHGCVTDYKNSDLRNVQRFILDSYGYRLIVQGVNEDWWIDPQVVPYEKYGFMFSMRSNM